MSNLIIEQVKSTRLPVSRNNILPKDLEKNNKVENKISTNSETSSQPMKKNFSGVNILESLSLIAGGGLLIYNGLTKFSKVKIFNKIVKDRLSEMEKSIYEFSNFAKNLIKTSFEEPQKYIQNSKIERNIDICEHLELIRKSPSLFKVLENQDNAFKFLNDKTRSFVNAGLSDFDKFKSVFYKYSQNVSNILDGKKHETIITSGDLTILPKFKNDKHKNLVEQSEKELSAMVELTRNEMDKIQRTELRKIEHLQSQKMAKVINDYRENVSILKEMLINETFVKVRKLLNLPEDFKPTIRETINSDNFKKLDEKALKRLNAWQYLDENLCENYYINILQSKDFSKFTAEDKAKYFYSMPQDTSINDIVILIDRLRLKNELDKLRGINSKKFYNSAISKLEYLYVTLKDFGETELLKNCSKDFDNLTMPQRKIRVYDVLKVAKNLGMNTISQVDKDFLRNKNNFSKMEITKYLEIFDENPELYFS